MTAARKEELKSELQKLTYEDHPMRAVYRITKVLTEVIDALPEEER